MKFATLLTTWIALASVLGILGCGSNDSSSRTGASNSAASACPFGAAGCACGPAAACDNGLTCTAGICLSSPATCLKGEKGCACDVNNTCKPDAICESGTCVDVTGTAGHSCYPNNTCQAGNACIGGTCAACTAGSLACSCAAPPGDACASGLSCVHNICISGSADAGIDLAGMHCFQSCTSDYEQTGKEPVHCNDGYLEFSPGDSCANSTTCTNGACVGKDGPTICATDGDCPPQQGCVAGQCASDCTLPFDCIDTQCDNHVCREVCTDSCPEGYECDREQGAQKTDPGLCMPSHTTPDAGTKQSSGSYALSTDRVVFDPNHLTQTVTVTNNAPVTHRYTFWKASHTDYTKDTNARDAGAVVTFDPNAAQGPMPLPWLKIGAVAASAMQLSYAVDVPANGTAIVELANLTGFPTQWEGALNVQTDGFNPQVVTLSYAADPSGHWTGDVYYFESFGDVGLDAWRNDHTSTTTVQNAFFQKWLTYRSANNGKFASLVTLHELRDIITSITHESWRTPSVQAACGGGNCYPTDRVPQGKLGVASGLGHFPGSDDTNTPIPRGPVKMNMGMDLRRKVDPVTGLSALMGTISSADALQYAGDPNVTITFDADPSACLAESTGVPATERVCHEWMHSLSANVITGARYTSDSTDTGCARRVLPNGGAVTGADLALAKVPWLLPGFTAGTTYDSDNDLRYTYECRDTTQPYAIGANAANDPGLAGANPVPDGQSRQRHLELVDGFLHSGDQMIILFRERFDSGFLGNVGAADAGADAAAGSPDAASSDAGFVKYGIMVLKRAPEPPSVLDPITQQAPDTRAGSVPLQSAQACAPLIAKVFPPTQSVNVNTLTKDQVNQLFGAIVDGNSVTPTPTTYKSVVPDPTVDPVGATGQVHYLCKSTNMFDTANVCGQGDVEYFAFTTATNLTNSTPLSKLPCNTPTQTTGSGTTVTTTSQGTCDQVLRQFEAAGYLDMSPVWQCAPDAAGNVPISCDNIANLLFGKTFYPSAQFAAPGTSAAFTKFETATSAAFRYKTQFENRDGTNLGFAPSVCIQDSNAVPYCYDPVAIEELRNRLSCTAYLYTTQYDALSPTAVGSGVSNRARADDFMKKMFEEVPGPSDPKNPNLKTKLDGFEFLNAELLIMLGDDAYTKAFESRFDLAGSATAAFAGDLFEPNGIRLSGGAGFEMYTLYQAAEYYQSVLDRFFSLSPYIWTAIQNGKTPGLNSRNFVTQAMVATYAGKLVRASTQKAAAWSEAAKRYQQLNRPDLARLVVGRAYTATYLESILFLRLLNMLARDPQIDLTIDQAKRTYEASLLGMNDVYHAITDKITYFGFAPDYVPFPIVDDGTNQTAFDSVMASANRAMLDARDKEEVAINQDHAFNSDSAAFQAQLTQIRNQYEDQLSQLCGTFVGTVDKKTYPAIAKYASLGTQGSNNASNPNASASTLALLGDPCGLVGTGSIADAISQLTTLEVDSKKLELQNADLKSQIDIEIARYNAQCKAQRSAATIARDTANGLESLQDEMEDARRDIESLNRDRDLAHNVADLASCVVGVAEDCTTKIPAALVYGFAVAATQIGMDTDEKNISQYESSIADLKSKQNQWSLDHACDLAQIESQAKISTLALGFKELALDAVKQSQIVHQALATIQSLHNQAARLEQQEAEAAQLAIEAAAAKNDPNTRIYKNDAIINADASFELALQAAYKATKVYEYYTSQSYEHLVDLTLVRLVSHGDYNLENYLRDLQAAYATFQENYGKPDVRVQVISMCDDILVPHYDSGGTEIPVIQRQAMCYAALTSPARRDASGYLSIPFSTTAAALSPITRNHKILYVEADWDGAQQGGSTIGGASSVLAPRVYLRQSGTSTVIGLDGDRQFFRFPERTAVIAMMHGGLKDESLDPAIYRSERFRDRPLLNTNWELLFNLVDEQANQGFDIGKLSDLRLFVYYTDFTAL